MCLSIPGRVVEITREGDLLFGKTDFDGVIKRVCLEYVQEVQVGEYILVHVGFALCRLDEAEAARIWDLLGREELVEEALVEAGSGRP